MSFAIKNATASSNSFASFDLGAYFAPLAKVHFILGWLLDGALEGQSNLFLFSVFILKGAYYAPIYCSLFNLFDLIELIYNNKGLSSTLFFSHTL